MSTPELYCESTSHDVNEQLFASATRVDYWLVLEVAQVYGRKALEESRLPEAVKTRLNTALASKANSRLQLIKKARPSEDGLRFFVAVNHEEEPNLYEFRLERYEDLLDLDIEAVLREEKPFWQYTRERPLYLVCTNGKRDACCARLGMPVFQAGQQTDREATWQTSHVGGHRFSGNLLILPDGVNYGYLAPDDVGPVLEQHSRGLIDFSHFRGRSCYDAPVQAAEAFLRRELDRHDVLRFKLIESEVQHARAWTFHFSDRVNGSTCCVRVEQVQSEFKVLKSCRESESVHIPQYRLLDLKVYETTQLS
jgi:hypothetical protein